MLLRYVIEGNPVVESVEIIKEMLETKFDFPPDDSKQQNRL